MPQPSTQFLMSFGTKLMAVIRLADDREQEVNKHAQDQRKCRTWNGGTDEHVPNRDTMPALCLSSPGSRTVPTRLSSALTPAVRLLPANSPLILWHWKRQT